MGGSDQRNRTLDGAGEVKLFISASDVRFSANNGLKSDIAPCPLCAKSGNLLVVMVAYSAAAPPTAAQLAGGVVILAGVLCSQLAGRALAREPREVAAP